MTDEKEITLTPSMVQTLRRCITIHPTDKSKVTQIFSSLPLNRYQKDLIKLRTAGLVDCDPAFNTDFPDVYLTQLGLKVLLAYDGVEEHEYFYSMSVVEQLR